uniref:leucine-rich repeat-containing protein 4B-like n=1 Tax=Styela clava TaxID=7725 RepID=UPI00193A9CC8|nr:leucine-rich repeat-containing protein 4B-like [Styela clava]
MTSVKISLCFFVVALLISIANGILLDASEKASRKDDDTNRLCPVCPENCDCSDESSPVCTDIFEIPKCFPDGKEIESLTVLDSPFLKSIDDEDAFERYDKNLEILIFRQTGLGVVNWEAFANVKKLKTLEISSSRLKCIEPMDLRNLQILNLSGNNDLKFCTDQELFVEMPFLETLDLRNCSIQGMYEYTFRGPNKLTYLNMNFNNELEEIPKDAFSDLSRLQELHISYCGLRTLYPEHFSTAHSDGSLESVKAIGNCWKCETMCNFGAWMDDNDDFRDIFDGERCKTPTYLSDELLQNLGESELCYIYTTDALIVIGALCLMMLILICCFALAFKNCFIGMCKSSDVYSSNPTSQQQSNSRSAPRTGRAGVENSAAETDDHAIVTVDGAMSTDSVGGWCIHDIDPPGYDAVVGKNNENMDIMTMTLRNADDADSMTDVAPPPYDEHAFA